MSGRVVHFELPADDLERAKVFYREAFGWTLSPIPGMDYTSVTTVPADENGIPTEPGAINGGMLLRAAPVTAPVIVVGVDDIDDTLRTVEKLGGSIAHTKLEVGDMGFAAYFIDTEGNVVGLWQSARA